MTAPDTVAEIPASTPVEPAPSGFFRSAFWFVVIGATNNLISYLLFALFVHAFGIDPVVAVTITYALGMIISFLGNRRLTFKHTGHVGRTIAKFVAVNVVGYGMNVAILQVFVHRLGYPPLVVQLFAILVVATITFFSMRLWVFRDTSETRAATATTADPAPSGFVRERNPRIALTIVSLTFAAAILVVVANLVLNPTLGARPYSLPVVVVGALVLLALVPALVRACDRVATRLEGRSRRRNGVALAVVMTVSLVITLVIGLTTLRSPGFDAGVVFGSARNLASGAGLDATETAYFEMYPNNVFLTLSMWKFLVALHLVGISGPPALAYAALVAVNAVALTVGVLLTFLVAKRLGGLRVALIALVPSVVFVVVSPWVGTVYSDTLGLVFPILLLFLFLKADEAKGTRRRLAWWGLLGLAAAVGYDIKPTVVFALIAIALVVLVRVPVRSIGSRALLAPMSALVVAVVLLGVGHLALGAIENRSGTVPFSLADNPKAFPLTHFLKMGSHGIGSYDDADVRATRAIPTEAGRFAAGLTGYEANVSALGPVGYADFLGAKALRVLGDGTFFQWREGGQTNLPFIVSNPAARLVQEVYGPAGSAHGALVTVWQTVWLALLALLALPLFVRSRTLFGDQAVILRVALLGLVVFLLLFEGRSRYLYLYLPFFAVLAALSATALEGRTRSLLARARLRSRVPFFGATR